METETDSVSFTEIVIVSLLCVGYSKRSDFCTSGDAMRDNSCVNNIIDGYE